MVSKPDRRLHMRIDEFKVMHQPVIFPDAVSVNRTFDGLSKGRSMIVGMIDYGTCGIGQMIPAGVPDPPDKN